MNHQQPLPLLQDIGLFKRTECSCKICRENCKIIPGYLIWNDFAAIYQHMNPSVSFTEFIKLYFLASDGAIVMKEGNVFRIGTIVPRRNDKGFCVFFSNSERCLIHKVAPFGCRYFDCKQTRMEADERTKFGLNLIREDVDYKHVWNVLKHHKLIAIPPEEARRKFKNG